MKNLITLVLAVFVSVQVFSQSRFFYSYQEIATEYNSYVKNNQDLALDFVKETKQYSEYIVLFNKKSEVMIIQYFTDGRTDSSIVYRTLVLIPDRAKESVQKQLFALDRDYIKVNNNRWTNTYHGIKVECTRDTSIQEGHTINEFEFNIKK